MFAKILIANRGEIACRIIRTARRLGVSTVAVYSEADRDALHVELADEAIAIGPAPAAQSYLSIEKIIEACRKTGATAVHPGYGFLSERAAFAEALAAHDIVFIGPNVRAIAAMGDKIEAKRLARAAGVSTAPGSLEIVSTAAEAARIATEIGFPVVIKASAGGGGKGMRVARSPLEVKEGFARAASEARSSFGDDRLFIEKFIDGPRHIEIQLLGDRHGHVIHLGERECSIQRRNQKIVEEAPSPFLDSATRELMGAQAVALARAVGYDSAGTVEFVVGEDRSFYFLEMNARLQVEHPVTEMVTGLDLVEMMIRIAAGEPLALAQSDVRLTGSAIESRICAEDPALEFLPSTGRISIYRPPPEGKAGDIAVRIDSGVVEGSEISIYYDPMIAKLITHAPTRAEAIAGQSAALDAFAIEGVRHNIPFLASLMAHPRWREGRLSTDFIAQEYPHGVLNSAPSGAAALRLAVIATAIDHQLNQRKRRISGQTPTAKPVAFDRRRFVSIGDEDFVFEVEDTPKGLNLACADGRILSLISVWRPGDPIWRGAIDGERVAAQVRPILNGVLLAHGGACAQARVYREREAELAQLMLAKRESESENQLLCPMPGLIREILVSEGQAVKNGEGLAVVEAMKMENVLRAERDATIGRIYAAAGQSLAVDAIIMDFSA